MTPKTPKERAEDLKAIGAVVEKLPSFKRDEYIVRCPVCRKQATVWSSSVKFQTPDFVEKNANTPGFKGLDRLLLGDKTYNPGPWASHYSGERTWRECRQHILACTNGELNDEERASVIRAVHSLRKAIENAPEMTRKVLLELCIGPLDDVCTEQNKRAAEATTKIADAMAHLREAARILVDPEPRYEAKREVREATAKQKAAEDKARMNAMSSMLAQDISKVINAPLKGK